jgi:hypothetical protein
MRTFYLALGISFAAACVCGAIIFYVLGAERAKDALDDARDYITGTEDARDAQDAIPDDQPSIIDWLSRFSTD